jgi:hypothetical protein
MGYIDCDSHVIECEDTWDYFDPDERQYRPVTLDIPARENNGRPGQLYVIGDSICRRYGGTGASLGDFGTEFSEEVSHLRDIGVRMKKMDALGVDAQVVISTTFLAAEPRNPVAAAAVCRSWNRWTIERTKDSGGRMRPLILISTNNLERAYEEMEFGARNNVAGVMIKGIEHGMPLTDPYFLPLFERAQDLDLTMGIHLSAARHHIEGLGMTNYPERVAPSLIYTAQAASAFEDLLNSDFNVRFPKLRFAILETSSMWVPYVLHHMGRLNSNMRAESFVRTERGPTRHFTYPDGARLMAEHNMFVACEADDDLPYVISWAGDENLVIGSDLCHNDLGSDPMAHTRLKDRTDISREAGNRITDTNGRRAFNIPMDFRPTDKVTEAQRREIDLVTI